MKVGEAEKIERQWCKEESAEKKRASLGQVRDQDHSADWRSEACRSEIDQGDRRESERQRKRGISSRRKHERDNGSTRGEAEKKGKEADHGMGPFPMMGCAPPISDRREKKRKRK